MLKVKRGFSCKSNYESFENLNQIKLLNISFIVSSIVYSSSVYSSDSIVLRVTSFAVSS